MANVVYRYRFVGPTLSDLSKQIAGAFAVGVLSPTQYIDITVDSLNKADLDDYMATQGFVFDSTAPTTTPAQAAAGSDANRRLLEKFIAAPAEGWPSGVYREVTGNPFPSALTWWTSSAKTTKIVEATYIRNGANQATTIQWKLYAADGTTVVETITDVITYSNGAEATRTRTISP